jgi:hypothetical protein
MDQDTSNSSGKASWREKLGIAPANAKDLPKIADEFKAQKPNQSAQPKLVAVREPKPVTKPAPMAPRAVNSNGLRPAQPSPQPAMTNQTLGERLRAEREAAEKLAKQRIAQARGKPADEVPAEQPAKAQSNGKPKFSFADDEIQQAKREAQSGRDFPGLPQRSTQAQQPPPLIPPRPVLGGAASMPPPANRPSIFQPRASGSPQGGQQAAGYRPLDPPASLARPAQQRDPVVAMPPPVRQPAAAMPRPELQNGYSDAPPRRPPQREAVDPYRRRPPQPTQAYDEGNGYYEDTRRRPAPVRGRQPAYDDDMGEVFEDDPRPQQQQPRRKASAQDYNQVYREYEGNYDEPRRSRSSGPWLLLSILFAGVLLSGGILYYYLNFMNKPAGNAQGGDVPVIDAPEQPAKAEPLVPDATDLSAKGSAQQPVDAKRKQIYDRILGDEEVGGNQMMPTEEQPQVVEPAGGQNGLPQPSNQTGQDSGSDTLPLPLPPPGDQGSIGTDGNQQVAGFNDNGSVGSQQIPEPASQEPSAGGSSSPPIPEADQATSLDTAMVPGEQHAQQPANADQPAQVAPVEQQQQPAMVEPESDAQAPVKKTEPAPAPVKQKAKAKKAPAQKQQVVENVEQADYSDAGTSGSDTAATGAEPLVLVPPGEPVASGAQNVEQAPPVEQKSRSFFNFGSSNGPKKLTGKAAERVSGLEASETVINSNYANARQAKPASDDAAAGDQVASLAQEPEAQAIPEPEPEKSAPEPKPQPQQATISGYVAQLASFRSEAEALAEYDRMRSRHGSLLDGLTPRVTKAFVSGSNRFRLGVGPLASRKEASKLCSNLIAAGERDCLVRSN